MHPEDPKKAAALNRCTFAEFTCMVHPNAPWEGLRVAVYLIVWLFLWDDCESPTLFLLLLLVSSFTNYLSRLADPTVYLHTGFETSFTSDTPTRGYVAETCTYLTRCLLTDSPGNTPDHEDILLTQFKLRIADPLFGLCDAARRAIVLKELLLYVKAVEAEQKVVTMGGEHEIGSVEEYWTYRGLSGAVRVCFSINE